MNEKSWIMLRVLLNRYHQGAPNVFQKCLPREDIERLLHQDIRTTDIDPFFKHPQEMLSHVHYSWIAPHIQKTAMQMQSFFVSSLNESQYEGLSKIMNPPPEKIQLSSPVKFFFLKELYSQMRGNVHIPLQFLPKTSLSTLATLSKDELIELIDFLGLYDLGREIRKIVDTTILKSIYQTLTPKKQQYLSICLHHKDRLVSPKMGIESLAKDSKKLENVLHRRGLIRLGHALSGQHSDLIWYLTHLLDIGRGQILLKYCSKNEMPSITQALTIQVANIMNFLKRERPL